MPHVVVKMHAGRSREDKARLAEEITKAVKAALNSNDSAISVGVEDVDPKLWAEQVYRPDILDKRDSIFKEPGYNPFS